MTPTSKDDLRHAARSGGIAGLVGGVVLGLLVVLLLRWQDGYAWVAFKLPAAPFVGVRVFAPSFDPAAVALGSVLHLATSAAWGALFGVLALGLRRVHTVIAGALFGVLVWIAMFYLVLPLAGVGWLGAQVPVGLAILEHVLFGLAVGATFVPFQRVNPVFERRPSRRLSFS
jgi:hypothetical protein